MRRLSLYQEHSRKAIRLQEEIGASGPKTTAGYSLTPGSSGTSDQVGRLAEKMVDKQEELNQYELEIRIIDRLIESLSEAKGLLIRLRYIEDNKDRYVMHVLIKNGVKVKSERSFYAMKDEAILDLAKAFGYVE